MLDPAQLSAYIASRICHDIVNPVSSVTSALDFLNDPADADMHAQARDLLNSGADKAAHTLQFMRYAFGSQGMMQGAADVHEVKTIIENHVSSFKPSIEWDLQTSKLSFNHARLLMNLIMIALDSLPRGGVILASARDESGGMTLTLTCKGDRAKLKAGAAEAVRKEAPEDGWSSSNVQPYFARLVADEMGGEMTLSTSDDQVIIMTTGLTSPE